MSGLKIRTQYPSRISIIRVYELLVLLLPIIDNYKIFPIRFSILVYGFGLIVMLLSYGLWEKPNIKEIQIVQYICPDTRCTVGHSAQIIVQRHSGCQPQDIDNQYDFFYIWFFP